MKGNRLGSGVVLLLIGLLAAVGLASCQEPQNSMTGNTGTISVRVIDGMDAKTISPSGDVDVSKYVITLHNEEKGTSASSGYIDKNERFSVTGVPAGTWYAVVGAYVEREEGRYRMIAEAKSDPQLVLSGQDVEFNITLDKLLDELSGDVELELLMPPELRNGQFNWSWIMTGLGGREGVDFSRESDAPMQAEDGNATYLISALDPDGKGTGTLLQGSYLIEFSIYDGADYESSTVRRKAVDVMRLLAQEPAYGTLDFSSEEIFDGGFTITVEDRIGNQLVPKTDDGTDVYELPYSEGGASLVISFDDPVYGEYQTTWYFDGMEASPAESTGKYTFTGIGKGHHSIVALIVNPELEMAVGSLKLDVEVAMNPSIGIQAPDLPDHTEDLEASIELPDTIMPEPDSGLSDNFLRIEGSLTDAVPKEVAIEVTEGETTFKNTETHTEAAGTLVKSFFPDHYVADVRDMVSGIISDRGAIIMNGTDTIHLSATFDQIPLPIRLEDGKHQLLCIQSRCIFHAQFFRISQKIGRCFFLEFF